MKSFKKFVKEACWTGYKQIGTKKKNGRQVPNCVPEEADLDESTIDKNHPIAKEYFDLKKKNLKDLKDMITQRSKISDTSEFRSKEHAASHLIRRIHGDKKVDQVFGFNEEADLDEGKNLTDTKSDWRSDKSATAKNWSHNKLMKVAKHDRSAEKEIKRRIASKEYVFANEEAEQIDELSKDTVNSYWKKAAADRHPLDVKARKAQDQKTNRIRSGKPLAGYKPKDELSADEKRTHMNRIKGMNNAGKRLFRSEEVELDEASDLRITKVYNKFPKKATYAVHSPDRKYYKEFDSMEKAKAHHAEKTGK